METEQVRAAQAAAVINISGDTATVGTAGQPEAHRELVRWMFSYAKSSDWSWKDLERETKISATTWYRIWTGKYVNPKTNELVDLTSVCETIARYKDLAEERAQGNRVPFAETTIWKKIDKVCREALVMQTIAFIYGESQIGKTCCLREYLRRNNHGGTVYVLMPAAAGVQSMMKAIARAMHISAETCFEGLRERVARGLDGSKLLMIDEVHECFVSYQKTSMAKCLGVLRQLQETSACGMVLCGTNVFRNELERGEFQQTLKQLRKRGIWELQLDNAPRQADLDLIASQYRLKPPTGEAAEIVKWIGRDFGFGKYCRFMARAAQLANKEGQRLSWDHFTRLASLAEKLKQREAA